MVAEHAMKKLFKPGDKKEFRKIVQAGDVAAFHGEIVHAVCSTFALARDIEWTTRLFVLDLRDDDEEGIGTFLTIEHKAPAFLGEEIIFTGMVETINQNELTCSFEAKTEGRLIASGRTGQKILKREKIIKLFTRS